jgi:AAA family ATP:ADP antiporter
VGANALDRRRMFSQVSSFTVVFLLIGQLTLTSQIITIVGITTTICETLIVSLINMTAIAIWPT